jgi:hypothetical protein
VERLANRLAVKHRGKIAAIDPKTGRVFIGEDELAVILRARRAMPKTVFELTRLGYPYVHTLKLTVR